MICNMRNENWWFLYFISPPPSLSVMHVWSIAEAHHTNHSLDQKMLKINYLPNHLGNQNCSSTNGDECKNLWASIDFVLMRIWWKQLANKIWNCCSNDIVFVAFVSPHYWEFLTENYGQTQDSGPDTQ